MFHQNLKFLRLKSGYSQREVSEFLNIAPQSISKWEKGEALPSIIYLPSLAKFLNCEINDFFKEESKIDCDVEVINIGLKTIIKYIDNKINKDEFSNYLINNYSVLDTLERFCDKIKDSDTINLIKLMELLNCGKFDAKIILQNIMQLEILKRLNDSDCYLVVNDAIDSFNILLRTYRTLFNIG